MCSYADFTSVLDALTCWLTKEVLKWSFLECGPTKSLTFSNSGSRLPMTIFFFSKCLKFNEDSLNGIKNLEKFFRF